MRTRHIPHDQWRVFAESFTRRHDGVSVSVFRERLERSRHYLVRNRPLHAVIVRDGDASVIVGGASEKKCEVPIARDLVVEQTDEGVILGLCFIEPGGYRTVMELNSPAETKRAA